MNTSTATPKQGITQEEWKELTDNVRDLQQMLNQQHATYTQDKKLQNQSLNRATHDVANLTGQLHNLRMGADHFSYTPYQGLERINDIPVFNGDLGHNFTEWADVSATPVFEAKEFNDDSRKNMLKALLRGHAKEVLDQLTAAESATYATTIAALKMKLALPEGHRHSQFQFRLRVQMPHETAQQYAQAIRQLAKYSFVGNAYTDQVRSELMRDQFMYGLRSTRCEKRYIVGNQLRSMRLLQQQSKWKHKICFLLPQRPPLLYPLNQMRYKQCPTWCRKSQIS